jgi:hypothetical protein
VSHILAVGNFLYSLLSGLLSSSTLSNPTTLCKKTCSSGCEEGSLVTSNRGWKTSITSAQAIPQGFKNLLLTTSSKLLTRPPALKTSYNLGTWISHRTLCEMSLWLMTHLASLSHSPRFLAISCDCQNRMRV